MSASEFTIQRRAGAKPGISILELHGPLQMETVPFFLKTARAEKSPVMIVDLTDVSYLDSSGIGALVQMLADLIASKRRLALSGLNSRVRSVMEVTRVSTQFKIADTPAEAEALVG